MGHDNGQGTKVDGHTIESQRVVEFEPGLREEALARMKDYDSSRIAYTFIERVKGGVIRISRPSPEGMIFNPLT